MYLRLGRGIRSCPTTLTGGRRITVWVSLGCCRYIWVGTNNGVFRFDPNTGRIDPKSYGLLGTIVRNIFTDREGNVWFGTPAEGVFQFRGDMFTQLRREDGLYDKTIMSLSRDQQGNYWFGSLSGGIDRYDGEQIVHYGEQEGLSSRYISTTVSDSADTCG